MIKICKASEKSTVLLKRITVYELEVNKLNRIDYQGIIVGMRLVELSCGDIRIGND